jgi:mannose-6-phosphate isomerase-like protein (cupin superfamily)
MLKIMDLEQSERVPLGNERGEKVRLVNASLGTSSLDVHMNTLAPGGPRGQLHKHSVSDNVYIVRSGHGELIVEGTTYRVRRDQVIFIPAGLRHSLSNPGTEPFEIFEIYAPAGDQFDFIVCE